MKNVFVSRLKKQKLLDLDWGKKKFVFTSRLKEQKRLDYSDRKTKSVNDISMKKQKLLNCNSNKRKILFSSRLKMEAENAEVTRFAIPLRTILTLLLKQSWQEKLE